MLIIRDFGNSLSDFLPLIREQEVKGYRYIKDEYDGTEQSEPGLFFTPDDHRIVYIKDSDTNNVPCKRIYFEDGNVEVTFVDRASQRQEKQKNKYLDAYRRGTLAIEEEKSPFYATKWRTRRLR